MNKQFEKIYSHVINRLDRELPAHLKYHCTDHTKYVLKKAQYIAKKEQVANTRDIYLLKIAALYHDIGFVNGEPHGHEERSCRIAKKDLKSWGFPAEEIDIICKMIMSTKIPQNASTQLEKILADADLEYLGTKHFYEVGNLLFEELKHFNPSLTMKKWNDIQIGFLKEHQYHTRYCRQYKGKYKRAHLKELIAGQK